MDSEFRRDARSRAERGGWWAGIAAPLLLIAGFFAVDEGGATPADGPTAQLVAEVLRAPNRIMIGAAIGAFGVSLFVWFGATLRSHLSLADGTRAVIGSTAFGFAVLAAGAGFAHVSFRLSLAAMDDRVALTEGMRALAILDGQAFTALGLAAVGLTVTMSVAGFTSRLLPRAMGAIGFVLSGVAFVFLPTDRGGFSLLVLLWLAVASGLLLARSRSELARAS